LQYQLYSEGEVKTEYEIKLHKPGPTVKLSHICIIPNQRGTLRAFCNLHHETEDKFSTNVAIMKENFELNLKIPEDQHLNQ
jgi:hypothetical protein